MCRACFSRTNERTAGKGGFRRPVLICLVLWDQKSPPPPKKKRYIFREVSFFFSEGAKGYFQKNLHWVAKTKGTKVKVATCVRSRRACVNKGHTQTPPFTCGCCCSGSKSGPSFWVPVLFLYLYVHFSLSLSLSPTIIVDL